MLERTWKACFFITTINQGSKVASEKLCVVFSMEPSTLLQNIKWKYSEIKEWHSVEVPTAKLQEFFGPILSKNIKISNAHNFGSTGPISKIPTLLSFDNFGEGQMKNPHFAGSPDMEWPPG